MKRSFLYWVSVLFVVAATLFFTNSSNCYAYSFNDFENFIGQIDGRSTNSSYINQLVSAFKGSKNAILTTLANNNISPSNYTYFTLLAGNSNGTIDFYLATNDIVSFLPSGNYGVVKYDPYGISVRLTYSNNVWTATIPNTSNRWISNQSSRAFIGLNKVENYSGNWQNASYNKIYWWVVGDYVPVTYLTYNNAIEDDVHNGNLYTYYTQGNLYDNSVIKLGDIIINDSYYYEVRLRNSSTGVVLGTIFYTLNTNNTYNDGAIYQDNAKNIYVTTRYLNYSTQYQLEVESYYMDGDTNLHEDIDWYIFLPQNAVISGDQITDMGSGEFNQQDSTNTIIGFLNNNAPPSGDIQSILNTGGSLLSGDMFKDIQMPQVDGMKRTTLFDLLYAMANTLGYEGDAYFDFQLHGETPTRVYASQFITPNGPLKVLISSFLVFFTFYFLLLQIRHVLEMLTTANLRGAIDYVDASLDNMFYM